MFCQHQGDKITFGDKFFNTAENAAMDLFSSMLEHGELQHQMCAIMRTPNLRLLF